MKPKKTARANLENKRGVFLQIGLLISLSLVIAAFEWSSVPNFEYQIIGEKDPVWEEVMKNTLREEIKKPPPPVIKPPDVLSIVEEIDPSVEEFLGWNAEPDQGMEIPFPEMPPEEEVPETLPAYAVNTHPGFQGGKLEAFRNWVLNNLQYPEIAAENGISGKVYIQFTVNYLGKVQDVKVIRGVGPALDKEAVRVVSASPDWSPGKVGHKAVNVFFTLPINFVLQ